MEENTTATTWPSEGTVTLTTAAYRELIISQTMLDRILDSAKGSGYASPDSGIIKAAIRQRALFAKTLHISASTEGDDDA